MVVVVVGGQGKKGGGRGVRDGGVGGRVFHVS